MATCPLCTCPQGTLAHIINFCPVSLNQGRLTWRHDSVLNHLYDQVKAEATTDIEMYSDLPGKGINNSTIPQDIIVTNGYGSKPDFVIISRGQILKHTQQHILTHTNTSRSNSEPSRNSPKTSLRFHFSAGLQCFTLSRQKNG